MKKTGKRWIGVAYAAVLGLIAAAGVIYCVILKNDADEAAKQQYAAEEQQDIMLDANGDDIVIDDVETPAGAVE